MTRWRIAPGLCLLLGALFFAASLTPSLIPRHHQVQGVLGGVSFALGYGVGAFLLWLWSFLELPVPQEKVRKRATQTAAAIAAIVVLVFLWKAAGWQNSIRTLMGMPLVDTSHPLKVAAISLVVAVVLILLGRAFKLVVHSVSTRLERVVPRRVALTLGVAIALVLFGAIADGVLFRGALHIADASYKALDATIEPDTKAPTDPNKPGSDASLIDWQGLGKAGRDFVTNGPTREQLKAFSGDDAMDPIRVYVGLNSADGFKAQAALALEELKRVRAFERKVLVVSVPTGTGWMDPAAMDTLEYLHRGDVATVAIQYSYLTSYISLLVEPDYGLDSGRELFTAVYDYWRTLPVETRPRLYLYGISLGAYNSQQSLMLHEIIANPIQGALWVGPPFVSRTWRTLTNERDPGSPVWRPKFEDGSFARFTNDGASGDVDYSGWGPLRIVYLQHTSDPVVFFEPRSFYRPPQWMANPRGPDVSKDFRWFPGVTGLQLVVDMVLALHVPMGHGHLYSYHDHIQPWIAVTQPEGWSEEDLKRLEALLKP